MPSHVSSRWSQACQACQSGQAVLLLSMTYHHHQIHHTASQLYQFLQEDTVRPSFVMGTLEKGDFLPRADVTRHGMRSHRCQPIGANSPSLGITHGYHSGSCWKINTQMQATSECTFPRAVFPALNRCLHSSFLLCRCTQSQTYPYLPYMELSINLGGEGVTSV